jgi:hypothetical protein
MTRNIIKKHGVPSITEYQIVIVCVCVLLNLKKKHETSNYLIKSDIHWWSTRIISIDEFKRKGNETLFIKKINKSLSSLKMFNKKNWNWISLTYPNHPSFKSLASNIYILFLLIWKERERERELFYY